MKKLKKISIFFLLIALTCCVVFVPQLISGQSEENLLNEIVYRNYNAGNRPKLTSEQVARLYCDREISIGYRSSPVISENSETKAIRENVIDLVEMLFGESETICDLIKGILTDGNLSLSYSRDSSLIKVDNQPTALNFVSYSIKNGSDFFTIIYEEKTKTIIRVECNSFEKDSETVEYMDFYAENIILMIRNYFEKQLGLSSGEYFFSVDAIPQMGENGYLADIIIGCEIMQYEPKDTENKINN